MPTSMINRYHWNSCHAEDGRGARLKITWWVRVIIGCFWEHLLVTACLSLFPCLLLQNEKGSLGQPHGHYPKLSTALRNPSLKMPVLEDIHGHCYGREIVEPLTQVLTLCSLKCREMSPHTSHCELEALRFGKTMAIILQKSLVGSPLSHGALW